MSSCRPIGLPDLVLPHLAFVFSLWLWEGAKWKGQSVHSLTSTLTSVKFTRVHLSLSPLSKGLLLSPSLSHLAAVSLLPPHTGPLPLLIPGEMTLSIKQTRSNLASASTLWLWPLVWCQWRVAFQCARLCVCVWQREREWHRERERLCVSQWGFACVLDRQNGQNKGRERKEQVSCFSFPLRGSTF